MEYFKHYIACSRQNSSIEYKIKSTTATYCEFQYIITVSLIESNLRLGTIHKLGKRFLGVKWAIIPLIFSPSQVAPQRSTGELFIQYYKIKVMQLQHGPRDICVE